MATLTALRGAYPELPSGFLEEVRRITATKRYSAWELLALMDFESGGTFAPDVWNYAGEPYVGLIQFGEDAATDLGVTQEQLASMTATEQLAYVEAYLDLWAQRSGAPLSGLYDLYSAVLWPEGIGEPPGFVFFRAGDGRYGPNSGLDTTSDGTVTKREAAGRVAALLRGQDPAPRQAARRASLGGPFPGGPFPGGPLLGGIFVSAMLSALAYDYFSTGRTSTGRTSTA